MPSRLGLDLSNVLFDHEPQLLVGDPEAAGRAAAEVAILLGCVMAIVFGKAPNAYDEALRDVVETVHETAMNVVKKANNIEPNVTPH